MESNLLPIDQDLRADDNHFDMYKGIVTEALEDKPLSASVTAVVTDGEWLVLANDGTLVEPGSVGVANTYLIISGTDRTDVQATRQLTIRMNGDGYYNTDKMYDKNQSYTVGMNLTVKGGRVLVPAGSGDAILARVHGAPDAKGIMKVRTLSR